MDIKKKANSLAKRYKCRNPFEIIRGMNVILIYAPLIGIRGFYQYFQRNNIIYIDENLPYHEKMFVCAHELGHMILHKKANSVFMDSRTFLNTSFYEKEADTFAVNLLIDDDMLFQHREFTADQLSRLWGLQKELVILRLK